VNSGARGALVLAPTTCPKLLIPVGVLCCPTPPRISQPMPFV
jgi:hypothetical protein